MAAILLALQPARRGEQAMLLGLVGFWTVTLAIPQSMPIKSFDPLGVADPIPLSVLALVVITLLARQHVHLLPLQNAVAVWTLTLTLMRAYLELLQPVEPLPDLFGAGEAALFVTLGALAAPWPSARVRLILAGLCVLALAWATASSAMGESPSQVGAPQVVVLAAAALWELLRSGARVTNVQGRVWPREARVVAYLGCILIGVAVAFFFQSVQTTPKLPLSATISSAQATGLLIFGVPTAALSLFAAFRNVAWPTRRPRLAVADSQERTRRLGTDA